MLITVTTITSSEFNQGSSEAIRTANNGPVFITDQGRPAHVLMTYEHYQRITEQRRNIADSLALPGIADIEFEPARVTIETPPVDLS
jgi:prevent-host-death family protein